VKSNLCRTQEQSARRPLGNYRSFSSKMVSDLTAKLREKSPLLHEGNPNLALHLDERVTRANVQSNGLR
jgi:hypothetical protein